MDIEDLALPGLVTSYQVISASRRTDIPGCHLRAFTKSMERGYIKIPNPKFPTKVYNISLKPEHVDCIAWWSKDYGKWIKAYQRNPGLFKQYTAHYFNFTINSDRRSDQNSDDPDDPSDDSSLEHLSTTLDQRLDQLEFLVKEFGIDAVNPRFDPIVHYQLLSDPPDKLRHNLGQFEYIMSQFFEIGIQEVSISFCEPFSSVVENMVKCGKKLITLSSDQKLYVIESLVKMASPFGIQLKSCCGGNLGLPASVCISADKIGRLLAPRGKQLRKKGKDRGQRQECNCVISRDVGDYSQECGHGCDYCYANPTLKISK